MPNRGACLLGGLPGTIIYLRNMPTSGNRSNQSRYMLWIWFVHRIWILQKEDDNKSSTSTKWMISRSNGCAWRLFDKMPLAKAKVFSLYKTHKFTATRGMRRRTPPPQAAGEEGEGSTATSASRSYPAPHPTTPAACSAPAVASPSQSSESAPSPCRHRSPCQFRHPRRAPEASSVRVDPARPRRPPSQLRLQVSI